MGPAQFGYLVGAFIGTGFVTLLLLWLLRKLLPPVVAIVIASVACLLAACTIYDRGFALGLSIYGVPQAVWLAILLVAERGRKASEPNPAVLTKEKRQRLEPNFGDHTSLREDASPDWPEPTGTKATEPTSAETPIASTATGTSARSAKTGNFILNHWRGLYSLAVSYWVCGFIITVVSTFGVIAIQAVFASDDGYQPVLIFFTLVCSLLFLAVVTVWQLVGVWRSANRTIEQRRTLGRTAPWAGVAKFMVIIGTLRTLAAFGDSALPQLEETYRMGFMGDPNLPGYSMRIMRNGTEVEITGGFKYGLTDDFAKLLKASPQIAVVHLNSIGGRIGEAIKLNKVIRDADLKTYVSNLCASACTVAFAGGTERWLYQSGILGFHGSAFPGLSPEDLNAASNDQRNIMVRSGYNASFVSKALAVPSKDLWKPTISELQAANVITSVSNGTQFAASGYGGNIQKQVFAEPLAKNIPILASLKERNLADFAIVLDSYYKGYVDGNTEEDNNNIVRFLSYESVRKYLAGADDQAIGDFGALMVDELTALKARDSIQCAKFGSTAGADPDIQYSFLAPMLMRYQSVGSTVIQTSVTRTPDKRDQLNTLFKRTIVALGSSLPQRQVSLLTVQSPNPEQASDYCIAIIGLYQQILKAPPVEAAVMLRSLM